MFTFSAAYSAHSLFLSLWGQCGQMVMAVTGFWAAGGGILNSAKLRNKSPSCLPPNHTVQIRTTVHKEEFLPTNNNAQNLRPPLHRNRWFFAVLLPIRKPGLRGRCSHVKRTNWFLTKWSYLYPEKRECLTEVRMKPQSLIPTTMAPQTAPSRDWNIQSQTKSGEIGKDTHYKHCFLKGSASYVNFRPSKL